MRSRRLPATRSAVKVRFSLVAPYSTLYVKQWNGTAFVEQLPGDAADHGIAVGQGVVQDYCATTDDAGHPLIAWQDDRSGEPEVYLRGNTFDVGAVYYVNAGEHDPELLKWWNWKDRPPSRYGCPPKP